MPSLPLEAVSLAFSSNADWTEYLPTVLLFLALWAYAWWRERQAQSWPIVQGTVEWTRVRVEKNLYSEDRIPEVCYSYTVNGEYYSGSRGLSLAKFDKYPKGSRILVHYKPSDPSVSFLDRRDIHAREEADEAIG